VENSDQSQELKMANSRLAWKQVFYWVLLGLLLILASISFPSEPVFASTTIPQAPIGAPMLINAGFECNAGTYLVDAPQGGQMRIHNGWTVLFLQGTPWLYSTRMQFNNGVCGGGAHVEKIEGEDSLAIFAHDLEWTNQPGKPFDVALYQQVSVNAGTAYSLSAWILSLCGGSTIPNDCPNGNYMAKMLGIDPTGGVDPLADTVVWVEDRRNFVENGQRVGWSNLRLGITAQSNTITVFARVNSPFQWHGNHAFVDAFSLIEAPQASFAPLPEQVDGDSVEISWRGEQGVQIAAIPGGVYELRFDSEYKIGEDSQWQPWLSDQPAGTATFSAQQAQIPHYFRIRARSEQLPGGGGTAWPNHRYPGEWSAPVTVTFGQAGEQHKIFMPFVQR
jgi:hypothetical protein